MIKGLPKVEEMYDGGYSSAGGIYRKQEFGAWNEWFAWRPVKVKGKCVWLKKMFRRCVNTYVDHDDWKRYEYGTAFDVIRSTPSYDSGLVDQTTPAPPPPPNVRVVKFKGLQDG